MFGPEFRKYKDTKVPEKVMDSASDEIGQHLKAFESIQREMGEVTGGDSVLLVDPSFNWSPKFLAKQREKAIKHGIGPLFELYVQKLFGGELPESTGDIFRAFLGPNVPVSHFDISRRVVDSVDGKIGAVMFAGSPANVSSAFREDEAMVGIMAKERSSHLDVYKLVSEIYRNAADLDLPVMGICYGHQMVSKERGGQVVKNKTERAGYFNVEEAGEYGRSMIMAISGAGLGVEQGIINTNHNDVVIPNAETSALLLRSTDQDPNVVQGLLHIGSKEAKKFEGDPDVDTALVRELMEEGKHVALTVQGHPEVTGFGRWSTFSRTEDLSAFTEPYEELLSGRMLKMFLEFLKRHGQKN